ncbi:hypothetical protein MFIFM68171_04093 [Madurella fahalii]|uniref:Uncharacterized protein n=1 Tax=Madurella fahalii TaxID=1157608 RepID=A0ABQ0G7Z4_9PEZI
MSASWRSRLAWHCHLDITQSPRDSPSRSGKVSARRARIHATTSDPPATASAAQIISTASSIRAIRPRAHVATSVQIAVPLARRRNINALPQ